MFNNKRDISEQMKFEDEDFLLGLKDQEQSEKNPSQQDTEPKRKDEGIEMEHDFEGELHDVLSSHDQESQEQNSNNEKEEEEMYAYKSMQ